VGVHKAAYQNLTLHYLHASKVKALLIKHTTAWGEMNQKEKEKRKRNFDFQRRLGNCGISASQKNKKIIKKIHAVVERGAPYPFSVGSNEVDPRRYKKLMQLIRLNML
jgi:hypothetical protein